MCTHWGNITVARAEFTKVTVFKLVGKIFFFCECSVNCELLYITGMGDEGDF